MVPPSHLEEGRRGFTAVNFAVLFIGAAGFLVYENWAYHQSATRDLSTLAEIIEANTLVALKFDDNVTASRDVMATLRNRGDVEAAVIYKGDGRVFATYRRPDLEGTFNPPSLRLACDLSMPDHIETYRDMKSEGLRIGTVYLLADQEFAKSRQREILRMVAQIAVVLTGLAFLLSSWMSRVITRPVRALTETTYGVATKQDYGLRVAVNSNDEFGRLAYGFNEMLGRIQEQNEALEKARETLEHRVEQRTEQLRAEVAGRKHAEAELRESESRFRSFYDSAPMLMGIVGLCEDDILHISDNTATERFFGAKPGSTRGHRASQMGAPKEVIDRWHANYRRSKEIGQPVRFEYEHRLPQGSH